MTILSNKIREYRFRNGEMTQKELAGRVGVSRQTMNSIENCRRAPTVIVAIRMADILQTSVDQLFELDYDGKPARREQAAMVTPERSRLAIEKPAEIKGRHAPEKEESKQHISMASLRNVLGS